MPAFTTPESPPPLSDKDSYTLWPGGGLPGLAPVLKGGKRKGKKAKKTRKGKKSGRRTRRR